MERPMKVTILKLADDKFRLRVETKDEFGKRRFAYETVRGDRAAAETRRVGPDERNDGRKGESPPART